MGIGEGLDSASTGHFLIWAGIRIQIQEPIVILENVVRFPRWLLSELLNMYYMGYVILSPSKFGWPISRERQFCVFL